LIERYEVGGDKFIQVINFTKHQSPHHLERASTIPAKNSKSQENGSCHGGNNGTSPVKEVDLKALGQKSVIQDSEFSNSGFKEEGSGEKPDQPPSRDRLKDQSTADKVAQAYLRKVGGKSAVSPGSRAIMRIFEDFPATTEAELMRCMETYAKVCAKKNIDRDFRLGAGTFFTDEWRIYANGPPDIDPEKPQPLTQEEWAEKIRLENEANKRRAS
jgi:hypothetical protein